MHAVTVKQVSGGKWQAQCHTCNWRGNKYNDHQRAQSEMYTHQDK